MRPDRPKTSPMGYVMSVPAFAQAVQPSRITVEYVVAPGGRAIYYITLLPGKDADGVTNKQIEVGRDGNSSFEVLLKPEASNDPKENLTGFSHLYLSPRGKTLYIQASAWATSNAVHSPDIETKRVSYVTNGQVACVAHAASPSRPTASRRWPATTPQSFLVPEKSAIPANVRGRGPPEPACIRKPFHPRRSAANPTNMSGEICGQVSFAQPMSGRADHRHGATGAAALYGCF